MKKLYTSPVVTVEELTKVDVLCTSTESTRGLNPSQADPNDPTSGKDNINQQGGTLGDLTNIL